MPRIADIPKLTDPGSHQVNIQWGDLERYIESQSRHAIGALDLDPDFQRGYVWSAEQKSRYCEYVIRGGVGGRDLYFNCAGWRDDFRGPYVIVDGKQRLDAVRGFLRDEVPVFGHPLSAYSDRDRVLRSVSLDFVWHVNDLDTREAVLQWYVDLNSGGTVHTASELDRVRALLEAETAAKARKPNARKGAGGA